jgi:hypothetical protein
MRHPALIQRQEFAVGHNIPFYAFESFGNFDVAVADDFAIAAVKGDLSAF